MKKFSLLLAAFVLIGLTGCGDSKPATSKSTVVSKKEADMKIDEKAAKEKADAEAKIVKEKAEADKKATEKAAADKAADEKKAADQKAAEDKLKAEKKDK